MLTISGIEDVKTAADTAPKLTRAQKADVVRRLAAYDSPGAIANSLKQDLGIEITRQTIAFYDPTRYSGRRCPKRWSDLFWETRAEIIAGRADVGAAHCAVRVRRLDQMACDQMDKGNAAEARALLKQAADEMTRMAGYREDGPDDNTLSFAELKARFAAAAAKIGCALVPLGAQIAAAGDGAVDEPQPDGEPLSG